MLDWNRGMGGQFACSANQEERFLVIWYRPAITVPQSRNLETSSYGRELNFHCGMDITPTAANYRNIMKVTWQWKSYANSHTWVDLKDSGDFDFVVPSTGSNYTLRLPKYNPIKHGGDYRCEVSLYGQSPKTSDEFQITSNTKVQWKNNKRSFINGFGAEETVLFTCDVWSYPFPDKVEMSVRNLGASNVKLTSDTDGIIADTFAIDYISKTIKNHFGRFEVANMSALFSNDSVLECRVTDKDGREIFARESIYLYDEAPPIETTTGLSNPDARPRVEPTKPWVIAIAVIIPIVIILIIVVIIVLMKYRKDDGDYYTTETEDPHNKYPRS